LRETELATRAAIRRRSRAPSPSEFALRAGCRTSVYGKIPAREEAGLSTLFSTSSVPQSDRFGYWHDAIRNSFVRTSLVSDCAEGFSGEIDTRAIDALNVSIITAAPMTAWRSDSDVRTSTPDVVFLQILLEGTSIVEQDGRQLRMRAGEMCLVDPSRPYSVKTSQARHAVLGMPASRLRRRVGARADRSGRGRRRDRRSAGFHPALAEALAEKGAVVKTGWRQKTLTGTKSPSALCYADGPQVRNISVETHYLPRFFPLELSGRCVKAVPPSFLISELVNDEGLRSALDAIFPSCAPVFSFLAIAISPHHVARDDPDSLAEILLQLAVGTKQEQGCPQPAKQICLVMILFLDSRTMVL